MTLQGESEWQTTGRRDRSAENRRLTSACRGRAKSGAPLKQVVSGS